MNENPRRHRGPHPQDPALFAADQLPRLQLATAELAWLLTRGYAAPSALKLVGDRHRLVGRQREAVLRCVATDDQLEQRRARQVDSDELAGEHLTIDGHNCITTLETELGGGVVLIGRDGCARDIAGMHGTYRRVEETVPAIEAAGRFLHRAGAQSVQWWLDAPVSNSGRLAALIRDIAAVHGWRWEAEAVPDPDVLLKRTSLIAASADGEVLDQCGAWCNLAREVIQSELAAAWVVDLS